MSQAFPPQKPTIHSYYTQFSCLTLPFFFFLRQFFRHIEWLLIPYTLYTLLAILSLPFSPHGWINREHLHQSFCLLLLLVHTTPLSMGLVLIQYPLRFSICIVLILEVSFFFHIIVSLPYLTKSTTLSYTNCRPLALTINLIAFATSDLLHKT